MGVVGGNDEREQTLNQLLTEMDGFASADKPVIVLAATNQPEFLTLHYLDQAGLIGKFLLIGQTCLVEKQY